MKFPRCALLELVRALSHKASTSMKVHIYRRPKVNLSVYICRLFNVPEWDQTSVETPRVFRAPKECLSKPQARIFMTVFNSVSVQF